ncbi:MAG: DUF4251 domain-containing protein [Chitinophagaceae bacterium]|nr:DUF4251 domain-containing protein [Chitinophagaceae bacterium]
MKKSFWKFIIIASVVTGVLQNANGQNAKSDKEAAKALTIKHEIESGNFTFIARSVSPLRGLSRPLNAYYSMQVFKDSVICYLPFIGRAYTAPVTTAESGIDFTSTRLKYNVTQGRKNTWRISIKPQDQFNTRELLLTVFTNGESSLQVTSNNRDPISFDGYIKNNTKE